MAKAKQTPEEAQEAERQQAVQDAADQLESLGWDGPFESPSTLPGEASSWRASRPGTFPSEQASSTLAGLVSAVEAREAELAEPEE